jgi:PAS domain S-box-containing protein
MNPQDLAPQEKLEQNLESLVRNLAEAENALQSTLGSEIDSVLLGDGRTYLLNKAREALNQTESRQALLATIVEDSNDAIYSESFDQTVLSWNAGAERIYGFTADEIIGKNIGIIIPQEQGEEYLKLRERVHRGEKVSHYEAVRIRKDGKTIWVSISLSPLRNSEGQVVGVTKIVREISERKKHEENLILKEKVLREISQGVIITDANRLIISANQAFLAITGYREEEILGRNCKFLQGPQTDAGTVEKIRAALNNGVEFYGEIQNYRKDGTLFWNQLSISPMRGEQGEVTHFIGVQSDITDRVDAETKMEREHDQLVQLLRAASQVSIVSTDPQGIITIFNEGARRLLGYDPEEVIGLMSPGIFHLESEVVQRGRDLSASIGGTIEGFDVFIAIPKFLGSETREWTYVRKNGTQFPVSLVVTCVRDFSGEITGFLGIATDLSQIRQVEMSLRQNESLLEETSEVARLGGWQLDLESKEVLWSAQTRRIHEVDSDFVPTLESALSFYPGAARRKIEHALEEASTKGVRTKVIVPLVTALGNEIWVSVLGRPEIIEEKIVTLHGTIQDVTTEHQQQLLLQEITKNALSADRAKSEFLGVMSHELRTPLNGILGFSDILLQERQISPDVRDKINIIQSSGQSLLRILEDILEFTRVEGGGLKLQTIPFSLSELAWKAIRLVETGAKEKNLQLFVLLRENVPCTVLGDPERIQQVLLNLLRNAVKFTDTGTVTLRVSLASQEGDYFRIHFEVEDTGAGIPENEREKIFLPFTQGDSSLSRKYDGIGMGLTIANRLLEKMGSSISLESQVGKGSIFSFDLSLSEDTSTKMAGTSDESELGILDKGFAKRFPTRILIVEDNPLNLKLALMQLGKLGYEDVLTAAHGEEALAVLEKQKIDLIFMDLQMPIMDGITTTKRIRALELSNPSVVPILIVALTANISADIRNECFKAGMNYYLSKPFNLRSLAEVLTGKS